MNDISDMKNLISDRQEETNLRKNEMAIMEGELDQLLDDEERLKDKELKIFEAYRQSVGRLKGEESTHETLENKNILLEKELDELELEIQVLKKTEMAENKMQESFSTILDKIVVIKTKFLRIYSVRILDKTFQAKRKHNLRITFQKLSARFFKVNHKKIFLTRLLALPQQKFRGFFHKLRKFKEDSELAEILSTKKFKKRAQSVASFNISVDCIKKCDMETS